MAENFVDSSRAFLGRGWDFPVSFTKGGFDVFIAEAEADIKNSLIILLSTSLGERVMQPAYGCNLDKDVFESLDTTFSTLITDQVKNAILTNEPRVKLEGIDYEEDYLNGRVVMTVNFTIISTNTRSNVVFPFYFTQGTNLG
ncbi:MAG: GPW/gp25 family protein [Bacteroidia bacterium]|nr:GPW/gp25 family protein [Bacteroidia bacterium]